MTLTTLAVVYVLGGLTFLPLLLAAILLPAWLVLPRRQADATSEAVRPETKGIRDHDEKKDVGTDGQDEPAILEGSAAAGASFAVLRSYHLPSAVAALNARNTASGGPTGTNSGSSDFSDGSKGDAAGSESVYQSMYRSVFDRSRGHTNPTAQVLENSGEGGTGLDGTPPRTVRKPVISASVFYIVLRHGHLMLYDSPSQVEVRHVISLAHHSVALTDGEEDVMKDADLFIKRTAIVLTPLSTPTADGFQSGQYASATPPKPFYLFSSTCIEKEDFYHALLTTRASPPIPQPIDPEALIKLQSTLRSASLTPETRAFNALVSRIFLSIHRTSWLQDLIRRKIEKKISRVQKPSFIAELTVKSISLGDCAPILSQPRLKDLNISGDMTLAFDLRYSGGVQVVIGATARIDLGSRFKARTMDLVLSTSLQRLTGKLLIRIKPPPSNRIWFCFESMPDMEIKVEPIVSTRQITYTFILRAIEDRIRAVVGETLVKPNWDDIPFFDTTSQRVRGGIWIDEGLSVETHGDTSVEDYPANVMRTSNEKAASMPSLIDVVETASAGFGSDKQTRKLAEPPEVSTLRQRSVASLPLQPPPPSVARPIRSPSFTSPAASAPSIAMDDTSGVPVRSDDASLQPKKWRARATAVPSRKEAVQAIREMHDRSVKSAESSTAGIEDAAGAANGGVQAHDDEPVNSLYDEFEATSPDRRSSVNSMASSTRSAPAIQQQARGKQLLAATAAATAAARNWSWNTIANRTGRGGGAAGARQPTFRSPNSAAQSPINPDQPIGRGQPLPPPGTPLPRPQKGLFGGLGSAVGGKGGVRRKPVPVLPQRRTGTGFSTSSEAAGSSGSVESLEINNRRSVAQGSVTTGARSSIETLPAMSHNNEEEFGPWSENSGLEDALAPGNSPGSITHGVNPFEDAEDAENIEDDLTDKRPSLPARKKAPMLPSRQPMNDVNEASRPPAAGHAPIHAEKSMLEQLGLTANARDTQVATYSPRQEKAHADLTAHEHDDMPNDHEEDPNLIEIPDDPRVEEIEHKFEAGEGLEEEDFEDESVDHAVASNASHIDDEPQDARKDATLDDFEAPATEYVAANGAGGEANSRPHVSQDADVQSAHVDQSSTGKPRAVQVEDDDSAGI
ncbi:hypothetical protein LTR62_004636 [Meristemomyces frigidus]|uniref:SMP-LTD domain-containing protein n=1 Tax=Meristemomyces frigidus TaxID=1508187 RepID=A0AAN7YG19_9PEZI|nr:hypothetical protein LTR62_004636 [Meristemomyces frigidus]